MTGQTKIMIRIPSSAVRIEGGWNHVGCKHLYKSGTRGAKNLVLVVCQWMGAAGGICLPVIDKENQLKTFQLPAI